VTEVNAGIDEFFNEFCGSTSHNSTVPISLQRQLIRSLARLSLRVETESF
jgi:hypothetical protein